MERKFIERHMDGSPRRGRPRVEETYFHDAIEVDQYRDYTFGMIESARPTDRTMTNGIYSRIGYETIKDHTGEFPVLTVLFPPSVTYGEFTIEKAPKSGILEQLGRMKHQNGFSDDEVVDAAVAAALSKQEGVSSKSIEKGLRKWRLNGAKW